LIFLNTGITFCDGAPTRLRNFANGLLSGSAAAAPALFWAIMSIAGNIGGDVGGYAALRQCY
jgi:hypothetical protein